MLKGLDPLLTPELLAHLASMGHGEWVAVVDANFTASLLAKGRPVVRLPGHSLARVAQAVLSVLPLADDIAHPLAYMHHSNMAPEFQTPAQSQLVALATTHGLGSAQLPTVVGGASSSHGAPAGPTTVEAVERFAFYERLMQASFIVQCGEMSAYGNALICKGLITQDTLAAGVTKPQQTRRVPGESLVNA
jgi:L-fucose mutarotase